MAVCRWARWIMQTVECIWRASSTARTKAPRRSTLIHCRHANCGDRCERICDNIFWLLQCSYTYIRYAILSICHWTTCVLGTMLLRPSYRANQATNKEFYCNCIMFNAFRGIITVAATVDMWICGYWPIILMMWECCFHTKIGLCMSFVQFEWQHALYTRTQCFYSKDTPCLQRNVTLCLQLILNCYRYYLIRSEFRICIQYWTIPTWGLSNQTRQTIILIIRLGSLRRWRPVTLITVNSMENGRTCGRWLYILYTQK